jgi:trehalose synthase
MHNKLKQYSEFVDPAYFSRISALAEPLKDKHVVHVNSTYYGGGVAEILESLIPFLNNAGIQTGWRLLKGNKDFFNVTKKFHDALQGADMGMSNLKKSVYMGTNRTNSIFTHLDHHDLVLIHDPQPLPLINFYQKKAPWLWRCHIDISKPNPGVWNYLKGYIKKYDGAIFSAKAFARNGLNIPKHIIAPAIDPLSSKNMELKDSIITRYLNKFGIPQDKPIVSQVSRFDRWKDPWGVIDAFEMVRKKVDCRLILLGSMASDDPDGAKVYEGILEKSKSDPNIHVISYENSILVNAVQRVSAVVIQNSIKEGFGLTVSEALWKGTPVVTRKVGGIPLQIKHGVNGYFGTDLHNFSAKIVRLLQDKKLRNKMGSAGHDHVKKNFLITRLLEDHLKLYGKYIK